MSHFNLLYDIHECLRDSVSVLKIIGVLLKEHPELEIFNYSVTNEYDDNNYSNHSRLVSINGYCINYDGDLVDIDDEPYAVDFTTGMVRPGVGLINKLLRLGDMIDVTYGEGDHIFNRDDFLISTFSECVSSSNLKFVNSFLHREKMDIDELLSRGMQWVINYALFHGKFLESEEYKLFAIRSNMCWAFEYAMVVGELSDVVLNYFILSDDVVDKKSLQDYIFWLKSKQS